VAILGPNGAGKTTALDMILGLQQPTSGAVQVYGLPPREAVDAGRVAAVTQVGGLLGDISVGDHVRLFASLFGRGRSEADAMLDRVGLQSLAKRPVRACSGGEKQLLKFAMALVSDPDIIILDEPTTGMDVMARKAFWQRIHADTLTGRTVLFATHYLEEADEYADRVVVIVHGRVVADGTTAEVRGLAVGRTVQADLDTAEQAGAAAGRLRSQGLAASAEAQGKRLTAQTRDSDALVQALFALSPPAHDILVVSQGLEEAFVHLAEGE
jgi:ABC-2 type transport system ATP-binding protein